MNKVAKVNTVLGPISPSELGMTLMHEHIMFGFGGWYANYTITPFDREKCIKIALDTMKELKTYGINTVVDATPNDCGKDPELLKEISEKSGINIVCSTGLYSEAEGKSPSTVKWYTEILKSFSCYAKSKLGKNSLSVFTLELVRGYILYLRQRRRFHGHPYTPAQDRPLSVETLRCHCRALKAFASWLHREDYTTENRPKNLKLPSAPATILHQCSTSNKTRGI